MTIHTQAPSREQLADSELIFSPEGRIYHVNLLPCELADTVLTVGDPERVPMISQYFDEVEYTVTHRELVTHTGILNGKRLSVISTGMGTPCIDIVINELDALANIDFETRTIKPEHKSLNIIRVGTAGGMQSDVPVGSFAVTDFSLGMDNLMWFYQRNPSTQETQLEEEILAHFGGRLPTPPYVSRGSSELRELFANDCALGITATCVGFYGPQNRCLRAPVVIEDLLDKLSQWQPVVDEERLRVVNFEMETSAIYGLAQILGHQACSVSAILANRQTGEFDHDMPGTVDRLIRMVLERVSGARQIHKTR